jgi:hypothetical protein
MAYTTTDFKSKKALKEAVAKHAAGTGSPVRCYQPGLGPDLSSFNGEVTIEGPHFPKPHTFYASATLKDGVVVKVK